MNAFKYVVYGDLTANQAIERELSGEIAEITRLPPRAVEERLSNVHGRTFLRNLFANEWPDEAADVGALTVAQARDMDLIGRIVSITGLSTAGVKWKMFRAPGNTHIMNLFADHWPESDSDELSDEDVERERLGDLPVRHALDRHTIARIAELTELRLRDVEERLEKAHANKLVRNVFVEEWADEDEDDEDEDDEDEDDEVIVHELA